MVGAADNDNEEGAQTPPLPLGLVTGVNTPAPALLMVHADHLGRPLRLTDASRATVWAASYDPFGQPVGIMAVTASLTGGGVLHRFPGLRVGLLEGNCGWAPWLLHRLDEHWEWVGGLDAPELAGLVSTFTYERRGSEDGPAPWFPSPELRQRLDRWSDRA